MGRYHSIIGIANGVDEYFRKAMAYISRVFENRTIELLHTDDFPYLKLDSHRVTALVNDMELLPSVFGNGSGTTARKSAVR